MKTSIEKIVQYAAAIIFTSIITITLLEFLSAYESGTNIHEWAPVKTKRSIIIHAPKEKVWQVFTNVNHWTSWQKDITKSSLNKPFLPGSIIEWETNGFTIKSQLQTVDQYKKIGWSGRAFGSFAIHVWTMEQHHDKTVVTVEESMEGWLVWLMQDYLQPNLNKATEYWLSALKKESEK